MQCFYSTWTAQSSISILGSLVHLRGPRSRDAGEIAMRLVALMLSAGVWYPNPSFPALPSPTTVASLLYTSYQSLKK